MKDNHTQCFSRQSGPREHLEFPTKDFLKVVDRLQESQPGLHPHLLSLWPDALCRDGLQSIVDNLQNVPEDERLQEISYQLVVHLHQASRHGIRTFGHEDLSVTILFGTEAPRRIPDEPERGEEEEDNQWVSESGETSTSPMAILKKEKAMQMEKAGAPIEVDEDEAADLVRSIDRLTRRIGMPWHTGFVVAGCMLALRHEMSLLEAHYVESTLQMAENERGQVHAFSMMACIRK